MTKKLQILGQRRERLVLEAAKQRVQLAQTVDVWRAPLALADQGLAALDFIKKYPVLTVASSAVLMRLVKKSFIGKWFGRGMMAWQFARNLQNKFF